MKCAKCQFENPEELIFCGKCGARLEMICPKCNFSNPSDFAFCGKCGNNLTLPETPTPKELSFDEKFAKIQRYLPKDLAQKILAQTINKQKEAFQWWLKAVQEGERLGARPQLARLYFEIGRCLIDSKGKYTNLNGIKGEEYFGKARTLLEEMKMGSSLADIDRTIAMRNI